MLARLARRLGLVPSGSADRIGEDDALRTTVLPHEAMVFFADPPGSLYQLEQWYEPLRALDREMRTVVVLRDSRTARQVRATSGLDVVVAAEPSTVEGLVLRGRLRLAIYVNHHPDNFTNLRLAQLVHVSLMHGDSDKQVTVSNQTKAYDFSFVAGQAAVDRMAASSVFFDASARCVPIGRPQVDEHLARVAALREARGAADRPTVLYAPTWEGTPGQSAYGTVVSHGEAVVRSLLGAGYRVVYRPHPLTGVHSRAYRDADARLRALVREAGERGRLDVDGVPLADSFAAADVLVCDVSGVAIDWLATGGPMVFLRPAADEARAAPSPLTEVVPWVDADDAAGIATLVDAIRADDAQAATRRVLVEHYLGDTTPGAATARFVGACQDAVRAYDEQAARRTRTTAVPDGQLVKENEG